ncbi:hypothetical protein GRI44_08875 [Altererythrobacter confluentis]|uniref:Lipoprotein n=2 Tax=Allopontixanthobacter confluentis TaxID=1849021 RepID=A0A6L7GHA6_9SPHN|nr:hypothetical protein [Allopontixanthobacter confluentis]
MRAGSFLRYAGLGAAMAFLAACQQDAGSSANVPGGGAATAAYDGIAEGDTVHFAGTEPFWGGTIAGAMLTYSTPENPEGTAFLVDRFAGNGGLGFTGTLDGAPFNMAITPGSCGDGMSDREYPFVVTLRIADETRRGCGWTDSQPFSGDAQP